MTIRTFFGKIRKKIIRLLLGRELFDRLTAPKDNSFFVDNFNVINDKLNQLTENLKNNTYEIIKNNYEAITVSDINTKTFDKYRHIHKGREIVLLATGPTLNYYEPLLDVITVGVNSAVLFPKVKLDYLFVQDVFSIKYLEEKIVEYPCKKFFRVTGTMPWCLPVKFLDLPDVEEYVSYFSPHEFRTCHYDIRKAPLGDPGGSVAFSAVQFALWTYPKKIYLVGCDCNNAGHFNNIEADSTPVNRYIHGWEKIKEFQQIYYPDVEIVSINPVGLKGMFKDMYTESYPHA